MSDSLPGLSVRARTCLRNLFSGANYTREQVLQAIQDGSLMAARNLGKKSYVEICACVGVNPAPPYRHLQKYSSSIVERAGIIKERLELQELRAIAFLTGRGYKVTKDRRLSEKAASARAVKRNVRREPGEMQGEILARARRYQRLIMSIGAGESISDAARRSGVSPAMARGKVADMIRAARSICRDHGGLSEYGNLDYWSVKESRVATIRRACPAFKKIIDLVPSFPLHLQFNRTSR